MPGQVSRNTGAQSETLRYQQTFTIRYPLRNAKCDIADQTKSQQRAKINGEGSTWSIWIEPSTPRTDCPAAGSAIQKWGSSEKSNSVDACLGSKAKITLRTGQIVPIEAYFRAAQAYMLISMPTDTSTIFGVFQVIPTSTDLVARLRDTKLGPARA